MSENPWPEQTRRLEFAPARPNEEVMRAMGQALEECGDCVLQLGVTPELASLGKRLIAVDSNENMIRNFWPGNVAGREMILADWFNLPLQAQTFTAIIGDGSFNALAFPDGYHRIYAELRRVAVPDAVIVLRAFLAPDTAEPAADVIRRGLAGAWAGEPFHAFAWRVGMAMVAGTPRPNIRMSEFMRALHDAVPDRRLLTGELGYPEEEVAAIDIYLNSPFTFSFPTLEQFRGALPAGAQADVIPCGTYALAERCPLIRIRLNGSQPA